MGACTSTTSGRFREVVQPRSSRRNGYMKGREDCASPSISISPSWSPRRASATARTHPHGVPVPEWVKEHGAQLWQRYRTPSGKGLHGSRTTVSVKSQRATFSNPPRNRARTSSETEATPPKKRRAKVRRKRPTAVKPSPVLATAEVQPPTISLRAAIGGSRSAFARSA